MGLWADGPGTTGGAGKTGQCGAGGVGKPDPIITQWLGSAGVAEGIPDQIKTHKVMSPSGKRGWGTPRKHQ